MAIKLNQIPHLFVLLEAKTCLLSTLVQSADVTKRSMYKCFMLHYHTISKIAIKMNT